MWTSRVSVREMIIGSAICALGLLAMPQGASAQAQGSYRNTCRHESVSRDGVLHAECQTRLGTWKWTSIQTANCRNRDIANNDGTLVCSGGNAGNSSVDNRRGRDHGHGDYDRGHEHHDNGHGDYDRDHDHHDNGHHYGEDRNGPPSNHGHNNQGRYGRGNQVGVVVYTGTRWSGRSMFIGEDYTNLGTTGFNDAISSVRINGGGVWRFCSDKNFGGRCVNISSSMTNLASVGLLRNISSIRRVR